ncbi:MAG: hypothetical protein AB1352_02495 [Patescibacteria group bacterium]
MNPRVENVISLILISFLALFFELLLIRWLPSNVLSLAYFSNIVLIASFLGLGLGAMRASRDDGRLFLWFPAAVLVSVVFLFHAKNLKLLSLLTRVSGYGAAIQEIG